MFMTIPIGMQSAYSYRKNIWSLARLVQKPGVRHNEAFHPHLQNAEWCNIFKKCHIPLTLQKIL